MSGFILTSSAIESCVGLGSRIAAGGYYHTEMLKLSFPGSSSIGQLHGVLVPGTELVFSLRLSYSLEYGKEYSPCTSNRGKPSRAAVFRPEDQRELAGDSNSKKRRRREEFEAEDATLLRSVTATRAHPPPPEVQLQTVTQLPKVVCWIRHLSADTVIDPSPTYHIASANFLHDRAPNCSGRDRRDPILCEEGVRSRETDLLHSTKHMKQVRMGMIRVSLSVAGDASTYDKLKTRARTFFFLLFRSSVRLKQMRH